MLFSKMLFRFSFDYRICSSRTKRFIGLPQSLIGPLGLKQTRHYRNLGLSEKNEVNISTRNIFKSLAFNPYKCSNLNIRPLCLRFSSSLPLSSSYIGSSGPRWISSTLCRFYVQRRTCVTSTPTSNLSDAKSSNNNKNEGDHKSHFSRSSVVVKVKDLEEHLRIKGYSTLRWGLAILVSAGIGIYMFREPIKENLSDEVADVATRSLGDQNVVLRANEVSKAIVNEIMNDSSTQELAADFVIKLLHNDDVIDKTMQFVIKIMNAPETRKQVTQLATDTVSNLLETESTRKLILDYIQSILLEKQTIESCKELLSTVASDPQSKQILADFFKRVLVSDTVTDQAVTLGKNVSREIVTDKKLQEESVDALWNVFKLSLTPGWFYSSKEISTTANLKPGK